MSQPPPANTEPLRYEVALIGVDGSRRVVPVITDRGPLKAVYLASSTLKSVFGKVAWEATVEAVGPVELDERGIGKLDGHIFDRNEW